MKIRLIFSFVLLLVICVSCISGGKPYRKDNRRNQNQNTPRGHQTGKQVSVPNRRQGNPFPRPSQQQRPRGGPKQQQRDAVKRPGGGSKQQQDRGGSGQQNRKKPPNPGSPVLTNPPKRPEWGYLRSSSPSSPTKRPRVDSIKAPRPTNSQIPAQNQNPGGPCKGCKARPNGDPCKGGKGCEVRPNGDAGKEVNDIKKNDNNNSGNRRPPKTLNDEDDTIINGRDPETSEERPGAIGNEGSESEEENGETSSNSNVKKLVKFMFSTKQPNIDYDYDGNTTPGSGGDSHFLKLIKLGKDLITKSNGATNGENNQENNNYNYDGKSTIGDDDKSNSTPVEPENEYTTESGDYTNHDDYGTTTVSGELDYTDATAETLNNEVQEPTVDTTPVYYYDTTDRFGYGY